MSSAERDALLRALLDGRGLEAGVPSALAVVERDPLASAGRFRGDLLRALMEVPASYWARQPGLYQRYRQVVRAAASLRRMLPPGERMRFWEPLDSAERGEGGITPARQRSNGGMAK